MRNNKISEGFFDAFNKHNDVHTIDDVVIEAPKQKPNIQNPQMTYKELSRLRNIFDSEFKYFTEYLKKAKDKKEELVYNEGDKNYRNDKFVKQLRQKEYSLAIQVYNYFAKLRNMFTNLLKDADIENQIPDNWIKEVQDYLKSETAEHLAKQSYDFNNLDYLKKLYAKYIGKQFYGDLFKDWSFIHYGAPEWSEYLDTAIVRMFIHVFSKVCGAFNVPFSDARENKWNPEVGKSALFANPETYYNDAYDAYAGDDSEKEMMTEKQQRNFNKKLYESIMNDVAKIVKKKLNNI